MHSSRTSPCWQLRTGSPPGSSLPTGIQQQEVSSGVHAWGCKRSKDGSRLFHFASWAPGWRYSSSVGFFGWTSIFLKTSLRVFKTNPWNFLASLLPFLQGFVQLSIVLCFSRTFSVLVGRWVSRLQNAFLWEKNVLFGYRYVNISVCIGTVYSYIK